MENLAKSPTITVIDEADIVYVIVRNDTIFNEETKENDDYVKIVRVFKSEDKANAYVEALKSRVATDANVVIFAIPTPFGDI